MQRKSFLQLAIRSSWSQDLLPHTSFQLASKAFWQAELFSQFFCYSNCSKNITCPPGKLKTEFISPIAKSTSPGLLDITFFAHWIMKNYLHSCLQIGHWEVKAMFIFSQKKTDLQLDFPKLWTCTQHIYNWQGIVLWESELITLYSGTPPWDTLCIWLPCHYNQILFNWTRVQTKSVLQPAIRTSCS